MEQRFTGKTALVTGAGQGIGAAIALLYAGYGAKVVVTDNSSEDAIYTVARIKERKGIATYVKADVNDPEECSKLIERTIKAYGSIDIACNNPALFREFRRPALRDIKGLDKEIDLDLESLFYCMKYELEAMQKQGEGAIVNVSYLQEVMGLAAWSQDTNTGYAAGEAKLNGQEYHWKQGIRINTLTPNFIKAALMENGNIIEGANSALQIHPGELSKIEQVIHLLLWLSL